MKLVKTKISKGFLRNFGNNTYWNFESRQAFIENKDGDNFENGDFVIFHNSNSVWTIKI